MRCSIPQYSDSDLVRSGNSGRWFHLWCLPTLWVVPVCSLWVIVWLNNLCGDATGDLLIAGFVGLWLAEVLGHVLGPHTSAIVAVFAQCIGGVLVMGMVGLFQDFLHVPKRIVVLYVITPLLTFTGLAILQGYLDAREFLVRLLLLHFCLALYAISLSSCVLYLILYVGRKLMRRT